MYFVYLRMVSIKLFNWNRLFFIIKKAPQVLNYTGLLENMAEKEGFEPSIRYRIHTFQACSFGHSDTFPQDFAIGKIKGAILTQQRVLVNRRSRLS